VPAAAAGRREARKLGPTGFPVFYPAVLGAGDRYMPSVPAGGYPLRYALRTPDGTREHAYRLVVDSGVPGNYYGVQGTTWRDPPILDDPAAERRTVNGKTLQLSYDGDRLRLVAWRTRRAVYWVSNTLEKRLTNAQMLAIAGSLTRLRADESRHRP
jgi:hypothetical protein